MTGCTVRTREAHTCAVGALTLALSVKSTIGTVTLVNATSMLLVYSEQLHTPQPYTVFVLEAATLLFAQCTYVACVVFSTA